MSMQSSPDAGPNSNSGSHWSLGAALGAAVAASACCTIPLALVSLGIGGAWVSGLTALAPYRWMFMTLAVGALGYAGYNEWRLSRRPDCDCETIFSSWARRSLLGVGALAVLALIASPHLVAPSPATATRQAQAAVAESESASDVQAPSPPASFQRVVLKVKGMTCQACSKTVSTALEGVGGVYSVDATYEPPEAVVRFDPDKTSVEALTEATQDAGYPSQPTSSS